MKYEQMNLYDDADRSRKMKKESATEKKDEEKNSENRINEFAAKENNFNSDHEKKIEMRKKRQALPPQQRGLPAGDLDLD